MKFKNQWWKTTLKTYPTSAKKEKNIYNPKEFYEKILWNDEINFMTDYFTNSPTK